MKKLTSILLSIAMLLTMTAGMTFTASAKYKVPTYDGFQYEFLSDGTVQIIGFDGLEHSENYEYRDNYAIPSYIENRAVTSIKNLRFYNPEYKPVSIIIPETVTNINNEALGAISSINVNENNQYYSSVDGVLFSKDKTMLISYPIVKENTSYTIPNGVTRIADFAFSGCINLKELNISDSVEYISYSMFGYYNEITAINVSAGNKNFSSSDGILFNKDMTVLIAYPPKKTDTDYTIPGTVISIGNYAFRSNTNLKNVVIPENVKSIGDYVFYGQKKITISDKVEHIGKHAFGNITDEFEDMYIDHPEYINIYEIYYGGTALQWAKLVIGETSTNRIGSGFYAVRCAKPSKLDNFEFYISKNGKNSKKITIRGYYGNDSNVVIPSEVGGYKITKLLSLSPSTDLFPSSEKKIKKVTIGSNVKEIGPYAFMSLTNLESVNVSKSNKYFSSSKGVLYNKKKTKLITFPNSKKCSNYKIPASVKEIAENAFYNCKGLKAITVDKKNKYFSASKGVLFNKKKTVLKAYPAGNKNKSYTVPKTVKTIDSYAFSNCKYLQTIKFSKKVTSIEPFSFNNCKKIKHVYYSGSKSDWKKIYFHYDVGDGIIRKLKYDSLASYINGAKIHYKAKV